MGRRGEIMNEPGKLDVNKPDFICVGAARCGTNAIYHTLEKHPDIFLTAKKEPSYFGTGIMPKDEYISLFNASGSKLAGDVSPIYLTDQRSYMTITREAPQAKIILILRDPIERSVSQYFHHLPIHKIDNINDYFENALSRYLNYVEDAFDPIMSIRQSFYAAGLSWFMTFHKTLVIDYRDLKQDFNKVIESVYDFLGVSQEHAEPLFDNESLRNSESLSASNTARLRDIFTKEMVFVKNRCGVDFGY